jgi:hypothetical protein
VTLKHHQPDDRIPFEFVTDENGYLHIQCTVCGGYTKVFDSIAVKYLGSKRFGKQRYIMQAPWIALGFIKFTSKHIHCVFG